MVQPYTPHDWFWIVGEDTTQAWSSAGAAYVHAWNESKVSRIASETELSNVLRPYGLAGPVVSIDDVRAEAQRRIIAIVGAKDLTSCFVKQLNANMRATELNDIRNSRDLTREEDREANVLRSLAAHIKAIRAASNILEPKPPADYTDNQHWPS